MSGLDEQIQDLTPAPSLDDRPVRPAPEVLSQLCHGGVTGTTSGWPYICYLQKFVCPPGRSSCSSCPSLLGAAPAGAARAPRPEPTPAPAVEAARAPAPVTVDGRLDDEAWASVPAVHRLHPARSRGGPAGDRAHRAAPPLRRRRPLRGGAAPRRRARPDREAPLAPRRERRGRPLLHLPRPPARPPHRRALRGERGRGPERRDHLQRHLDGRLVGRGVALRRPPRRAGLVGGDADPLLRAALPPRRLARPGASTPRASSRGRTRATGSRSCRRPRAASPRAWPSSPASAA